MYDHFYAVIMAGGSGTRLWPLSRKNHPKQSLRIYGNRTLFQCAVDRLEGLFPYERIMVVTVADQVKILSQECPEIPMDNYVIEPLPRGTASVVGLASIAIQARDRNGTMAILTADHLMKNDAHFRQLLRAAYAVAQDNVLVTLGITPSYPATGYGYIQMGHLMGQYEGLNVYNVKRFKEKPNEALATTMVADGKHVWNSGMFIWRVATVMAAFECQMPDLFEKLGEIADDWMLDNRMEKLGSIWPNIKPQTIDYGIMEKAQHVAVIPSIDLGWNDVGSWDSLFDAIQGDAAGNIILKGDPIIFDTQGTLICDDSSEPLIVTIGVEDMIIVNSGDVVLVCDRKHAQRVREVVNFLKEQGREDYL
jgi:mannose-1-phosphate guanylyltransferase